MPQNAPHFTRLPKSSTIGYKPATLWLSTVCETIQLFASTKIRFWATLKPVLITLFGNKMKIITIFLALVAPMILAAEVIPEVRTMDELKKNIDKRVVLEGVYSNPHKGYRSVDCGFVQLNIGDYSFYSESKDGHLIEEIERGKKIRFEATIRYFKGSKSLVKTHPIVQEELPPKQIIKGKEYYVYPPSYSISDAKLIR